VAHTHEVLSNLSALYADILSVESARRAYLDAIAKRHLETIGRVSRHMGQLIDDLLAFSRIGQGALVRTRVALGPLTREIVEALRPATEGCGDRALLHIVFNNLLGNAVKYTRPRPRAVVEIGCATGSTGEIVVFVKDNGVGFDMQYADKLFGVFQRLHRSEEFEGTGIGLATVRRIIQRHGGRTWAEAAVDGGATFYVALPARAQENA
jgi:signal transduction histidine kinase